MTADYQPPSTDMIRERTADSANRKIDRITRGAIAEAEDSPAQIRARIAEIDREWNVDRALMANFAIAGAITGGLAMRSLKRTGRLGGWGKLFWTQMAFLFHHAARGWCPPMPVMRRLGFRSSREICAERCALEHRLRELGGSTR
ncbi:MAG TPA: hypothetical protein VIU61_12335 [Kofleriaceae bacterium]